MDLYPAMFTIIFFTDLHNFVDHKSDFIPSSQQAHSEESCGLYTP